MSDDEREKGGKTREREAGGKAKTTNEGHGERGRKEDYVMGMVERRG